MKKSILLLLMAILLCLCVAGCRKVKDINDLAYVLAIGVDQGQQPELSVYTFQFIKPSNFVSGQQGKQETGEAGSGDLLASNTALENVVIQAPTLYVAMDLCNSTVAKRYDFSLMKLMVFAQDKARAGIKGDLDAILQSREFHPNVELAIAATTAAEYLAHVNPPLGDNPTHYYSNLYQESFAMYSPELRLRNLHLDGAMHNRHIVFPLVGTAEATTPEDFTAKYGEGIHPTVDFQAGEPFQISGNQSGVLGMAILEDDRVTQLTTAEDAFCYYLLRRRQQGVHYSYVKEGQMMVLELRHKSRPQTKVTFAEGEAQVEMTLSLEGEIVWAENKGGNLKQEQQLSENIAKEMEQQLTAFLFRLSREYHADILQFSNLAKRHYLTVKAFEDEDWQGLYEQAQFVVNVELNIEREGVLFD